MNTLPRWWQNGVIYQIYPKSFQDTTGSGTGDLRGVTARLDYIRHAGGFRPTGRWSESARYPHRAGYGV